MTTEIQARIKCDRCGAMETCWVSLPTISSSIERGGSVSATLEVAHTLEGWKREAGWGYRPDVDVCPACSAKEAADAAELERIEIERRARARARRKAKKEASSEPKAGTPYR